MFTDIVFTRGHENEFVEMAVKLGYSKIIFAHPHMDDIGSLVMRFSSTQTKRMKSSA